MYNIIIASHGGLASGLCSSLEMIAGQQSHIYSISLSSDESPEAFLNHAKSLLHELNRDNGVLVLTDILGGTPTLSLIRAIVEISEQSQFDYECISGVNLPLLLESVFMRDFMSLGESVNSILLNASSSITNVKASLTDSF